MQEFKAIGGKGVQGMKDLQKKRQGGKAPEKKQGSKAYLEDIKEMKNLDAKAAVKKAKQGKKQGKKQANVGGAQLDKTSSIDKGASIDKGIVGGAKLDDTDPVVKGNAGGAQLNESTQDDEQYKKDLEDAAMKHLRE